MAKFIIKPREIAEGFTNLAKKKVGLYEDDVEAVFDARMKVCGHQLKRKRLMLSCQAKSN